MKNEQAQALATRFVALNEEVIAFVENCSESAWQTLPPGEARTVGVVAQHIATSHGLIAGVAKLMATGQSLPVITVDLLDQGNAAHATHYAGCTKAEVSAALRQQGAEAAAFVRNLSAADLAQSAYLELFGAVMTVQQVIENVLLGHARGHLETLRSTVPAA